MLPDFICVGAQRAGTTWLYECLREHPQVFVPEIKELQFFNARFDKGVAWYEQHFSMAEPHQHKGDITPNYLGLDYAIERMHEIVPAAKIIIILRDPVERVKSAYQLFKEQRFPDLSLVDACKQHEFLLSQSYYAEPLQQIFKRYNRNQVFVAYYHDLSEDPKQFMRRVYDFIGVDKNFVPEVINKRYNKVVYPKLQNVILKLKLEFLIEWVKASPLGDTIRKRAQRKPSEVSLPESDLDYFRSIFEDDIRCTEKILNVDLSRWRNW